MRHISKFSFDLSAINANELNIFFTMHILVENTNNCYSQRTKIVLDNMMLPQPFFDRNGVGKLKG